MRKLIFASCFTCTTPCPSDRSGFARLRVSLAPRLYYYSLPLVCSSARSTLCSSQYVWWSVLPAPALAPLFVLPATFPQSSSLSSFCCCPNESTASAYATAAPKAPRTALRERRRKRSCFGFRGSFVLRAAIASPSDSVATLAWCSAYCRASMVGVAPRGTAVGGKSGGLAPKKRSETRSQKETRFACDRIATRRRSLGSGQRRTAVKYPKALASTELGTSPWKKGCVPSRTDNALSAASPMA
mmetsp:Transcript_28468/g.72947  ORF Transcript_28468/g.72947 Transcript_28468/m.72947 type:complete len:243 (+) Transcript_28468:103-831(+)